MPHGEYLRCGKSVTQETEEPSMHWPKQRQQITSAVQSYVGNPVIVRKCTIFAGANPVASNT